ncbi:hypothetical protein ACRRTK_022126 [Alexandromys fortis]
MYTVDGQCPMQHSVFLREPAFFLLGVISDVSGTSETWEEDKESQTWGGSRHPKADWKPTHLPRTSGKNKAYIQARVGIVSS